MEEEGWNGSGWGVGGDLELQAWENPFVVCNRQDSLV